MDAVKPYTYIVQKTKGGKVVLIATNPQEVEQILTTGYRVEVWLKDQKVDTIYTRTRERLSQYKNAIHIKLDQKQIIAAGMQALKQFRDDLTAQQYKTLKGQILTGEVGSALKGLQKIRRRLNADTT